MQPVAAAKSGYDFGTAQTVVVAASATTTVAPNDATDQKVTWTSSDDIIATVANEVVNTSCSWNSNHYANTEDDNKTASCSVNVNP